MRTPTVEEFEAVARDAPPFGHVPIGDEGVVTTREDARLIALVLRMREAEAREVTARTR